MPDVLRFPHRMSAVVDMCVIAHLIMKYMKHRRISQVIVAMSRTTNHRKGGW